MKVYFRVLVMLLMLIASNSYADTAQNIYTFETPQQQNQFLTLTQTLRCLVCQNETLADSNAPLANDLRNDIAQRIQQGQTNQQIQQYMVNRYGNFILYQPTLSANTYLLWFTPVILLLIGLLILIMIIRKHSKKG